MQAIDWLLEKLKARPAVAVVIAASIIVALWTFEPVVSPYVRVAGNSLNFKFQCLATQVEIDGTFQSAPTSTRLIIKGVGTPGFERTLTPVIQGTASSGKLYFGVSGSDIVGLRSLGTAVSDTELEMTAVGSTSLDVNRVVVSPTPAISAPAGDCAERDFPGTRVLKVLVSGDSRIMRYRLLQEDFARIIYRFNATIGNVLIGVLAIAAVWLIYDLQSAWFEKPPSVQGSSAQTLAQIEARFLERFRTLNLWRAIGPAMGFMLTVSSLVESLRPATQSSQNAYAFISGIQMAVVATFLGLAIRILCELDINTREKRTVESIRALEGAGE